MPTKTKIDTTFSMYLDSNNKDPDSHSKTLNHYHWLLWNKDFPNSSKFDLIKTGRKKFLLELQLEKENIVLSSDSIIHTYSAWAKMKNIINEIGRKDIEEFKYLGSTIGGYIVFPAKRVHNSPTINAIRGMNPFILDRFDFTLECIKRYYARVDSPLYKYLNNYKSFFDLFVNFEGYVDFFLLNDLVDKDYNIKFWLPFINFQITLPLPKNAEEYNIYMYNVISFINKRNKRILNHID